MSIILNNQEIYSGHELNNAQIFVTWIPDLSIIQNPHLLSLTPCGRFSSLLFIQTELLCSKYHSFSDSKGPKGYYDVNMLSKIKECLNYSSFEVSAKNGWIIILSSMQLTINNCSKKIWGQSQYQISCLPCKARGFYPFF